MYWSQQQPIIGSSSQYHSILPQDEHWQSWDLLPSVQDQKDYLFQPQMSILPSHLLMPDSSQQMHQSWDYDRSTRYDSPTTSHYSSAVSESSASTEHALTPNTMYQSTPFGSSTTNFLAQHSVRLPAVPLPQHTVWHQSTQDSFAVPHNESDLPAFVPFQFRHLSSELNDEQHEQEDLTITFDDEIDPVHSKSPIQIPHPEELELCEDQHDSQMSCATDTDRATPSSGRSFQSNGSDEETEDEDLVIVDHDSDSDYDNRSGRRRKFRSTPKQKHARKSASNTIVSTTSRIHKRTSSSLTAVSSSSASTPRSHTRRTSKSTKSKARGPQFIKAPSTLPKGDRIYPCTFHRFGCSMEFPNKNEWKRHVACQHLQLGYFRCDLDGCNPDSAPATSSSRPGRRNANALTRTQSQTNASIDEIVKIYNDFNRKDLFTQHCRRMHGPARNPALRSKPLTKKNGQLIPAQEDEAAFEAQLTEIRGRCWHVRRHAPSRSSCGFCKRLFDAENYETSSNTSTSTGSGKDADGNAEEKAWEERMEHVGKHYEKEGFDQDDEEMDEDLVEWGLETGVLRTLPDGRPWLVSAEDPMSEEDIDETGSGRASKGSGGEEEKERKKSRRQPSRTIVKERLVSEEGDTVVVGGGK